MTPLFDAKWYWTTLGNCAMTVDEKSQIYSGDRWKFPKGTQPPDATQIIYGLGAHVGIQRAWSNSLYIGVTQDRSLFMTSHYLADIFAAFGDEPHSYDLAWHFRAAAGAEMEVITGNGHFFVKSAKDDEFPPTLIQRRTSRKEVLFANVVDVSGNQDGYVKGVSQVDKF